MIIVNLGQTIRRLSFKIRELTWWGGHSEVLRKGRVQRHLSSQVPIASSHYCWPRWAEIWHKIHLVKHAYHSSLASRATYHWCVLTSCWKKNSTYFKISDLWLIVGVSQIITAVSFWLTRSQDEPDGQFEARVTHSAHYPVSSRTSNHNHVLRDPPDAPDVDTLTPVLTHSQIFKSTENSARNFVFHNKQRKYCCGAYTQPLNIARVRNTRVFLLFVG